MREIRSTLNRFKLAFQQFHAKATADWVAAFE